MKRSIAAVTTAVGGQTMTMTFSTWGEPTSIAAPPASEVGTLTVPTS